MAAQGHAFEMVRPAPTARPGARATLAILLAVGLPATAAPEDPNAPAGGIEKGPLLDVRDEIAALAQLRLHGKALAFDREHWTRAAQGKSRADRIAQMEKDLIKRGLPAVLARRQAERMLDQPDVFLFFDRIRSTAGAAGASSTSIGAARKQSFVGQVLSGSLSVEGEAFELWVREEQGPRRDLTLADDGKGALRISLFDPSGRLVLVLNQQTGGAVRVVDVRGRHARVMTAESFLDLYAAHADYVNGGLLPMLNALGIGPPMSPHSPAVKAAVIDLLRAANADQADKARALIRQLDDEKYAKREAAMAELGKAFVRFQPFIEEALAGKDLSHLSPEALRRLGELVEANRFARQVGQVAIAFGLTRDVDYLIGLLGEAAPADRPVIAEAIRMLTGQQIKDDPAAWRAWRQRDTAPR